MLALHLAVDSFQQGVNFYLAFNLEYGKILPVWITILNYHFDQYITTENP